MLNWLRRNKETPPANGGFEIRDANLQKHEGSTRDITVEAESQRKYELSKVWGERVKLSTNLHRFLIFLPMNLGHREANREIPSTLKPIKLLESSGKYPLGSWTKQKLVLHFIDTRPAIGDYPPIVGQLGIGLESTDVFRTGNEVEAFVYDDDPVDTPRLERRHQLRLVKDLTALGIDLNVQLASIGFRLSHINLERRSHSSKPVPTGGYTLHISSVEEVKYMVAIPPPSA